MTQSSEALAENEKRQVALSSVLAAVFLTILKLVVGLLTNSLGILSEAAHSGLDLVAAGITYFAVRVSDRPPDREHPYGHGKVENISALFETILLLITCIWIIYEAIQRLIAPEPVEATFWSFAVMGTSILVDITRSRALMRTAKKYNSQALEADALHFSTDVWSSSVVIMGLLGVWLAGRFAGRLPIATEWLYRADAIAALIVSAIVIFVSYQLGRRTINVLLDGADYELSEQIEARVRQVPGVLDVHRLRLRQSGPATFVDMALDVPRNTSLEEAHRIASEVEDTIEEHYSITDVVVRLNPGVLDADSLIETVSSAAARQGLGVHAIRAQDIFGQISLGLHLEVPESLSLNEAHQQADQFEDLLRTELPDLYEINTHLEPVGESVSRHPAVPATSAEIHHAIIRLPKIVPGVEDCHHVSLYGNGNELSVSFHCRIDPGVSISEAHQLTVEMENYLRAEWPELGRIIIHTEPKREELSKIDTIAQDVNNATIRE